MLRSAPEAGLSFMSTRMLSELPKEATSTSWSPFKSTNFARVPVLSKVPGSTESVISREKVPFPRPSLTYREALSGNPFRKWLLRYSTSGVPSPFTSPRRSPEIRYPLKVVNWWLTKTKRDSAMICSLWKDPSLFCRKQLIFLSVTPETHTPELQIELKPSADTITSDSPSLLMSNPTTAETEVLAADVISCTVTFAPC